MPSPILMDGNSRFYPITSHNNIYLWVLESVLSRIFVSGTKNRLKKTHF
jgi:hypothetical protein